MAIRTLSNQTIDSTLSTAGAITSGGNLRVSSGILYVGNGSNTTARIMGFGDTEMITGVSGATYLRVSGSSTLAGTLQSGQYILAAGLAYGAVNSYTQIIDGSTGAITGTTADFAGKVIASNGIEVTGGSTGADIYINNTSPTLGFTDSNSFSDPNDIYIIRGTSSDSLEFQWYDNSAGTTERTFIIDSVGNATFEGDVGIGSFPTQKLDVVGSGGNTNIRVYDSSANSEVGLQLQNDAKTWQLQNWGSGGDNLRLLNNAGNIVQLWDDNGNVMIGNANDPATKLQVVNAGEVIVRSSMTAADGYRGGFEADNQHTGGTIWSMFSTNNSDGYFGGGKFVIANESMGGVDANTTAKFVIDGSGNVGIGTTSPGAKLEITSSTAAGALTITQSAEVTGNAMVYIDNNSASNKPALRIDVAAGGNSTDTHGVLINNNGPGYGLIVNGGNVGIGTTSPNAQLEVETSSYSAANAIANFVNGNNPVRVAYDTVVIAQTDVPALSLVETVTGSQANEQKLNFSVGDFKAVISSTDTVTNGIYFTVNRPTNQPAYNTATGTIAMNINNNGNVGIGETSPSAKLQIKGTGAVSGLTFKTTDSSSNETFYINDGGTVGVRYYPFKIGVPSGTANVANSRFQIATTAGDFVVLNDGKTGIGTTSPNYQLEVRTTTNNRAIQAVNSTTSGTNWGFQGGAYGSGATKNIGLQVTAEGASTNYAALFDGGNVGIGTTSPNYNLEIGGTANPVVAIVSNINSATSSLYFGDSDAKDRGQIRYTHFGDFMELKAGGATRVYIESGINTAYTSDGLFNSNATPSYWNHGNGQFKLGYMDNGSGLYSGAYAFNVKSTDGIPVTGREIGAIYINDVSNGRKPLRISNQGRITIEQTNTSTSYGSATGWLTIANGTSAYNFFNAYTGTDGGSGCARYRLNNTSPSFFDFYYQTTQVGYITTNGTDIFYANTSDYRLKEDLKSFNGMSLLEQIQVYDFKWKESDNRMYGVVAHELQEVVPQAVVGEKDEDKLQAVDYSKLVPVLIKSIQELEARVKELENN